MNREQHIWPTRSASPGRRSFLVTTLAGMAGFILGWLFPERQRQLIALPDKATTGSLQGDSGQFYHRWSKLGNLPVLNSLLDWGEQPARYKIYSDIKRIALPDPHGYRGLSLGEAIEQRRSRRAYLAEPLSLVEMSRLLHAASGLTAPAQGLRAAPSAGALYPIEIYPVVHNVVGLEPGLYHYNVVDHALEQLRAGDLRTEIVAAGIGQEMLGQAQACFVLSAIFQRTRWKYQERAYRYVLLEAGHIGQNLYLAATSVGLGACAAGAFLDDKLNELLRIDGEQEAAVYLIAVGKI